MPYKNLKDPLVIEKLRQSRRNWYNRNKKHAKDKLKENRKKIKEWFRELKKNLSCSNCSENHPACLDFHHRDRSTKESSLALVAHECWSKKKILREIEKCDVLCANCHRKWHFEND